jgi:hypothetical protein
LLKLAPSLIALDLLEFVLDQLEPSLSILLALHSFLSPLARLACREVQAEVLKVLKKASFNEEQRKKVTPLVLPWLGVGTGGVSRADQRNRSLCSLVQNAAAPSVG